MATSSTQDTAVGTATKRAPTSSQPRTSPTPTLPVRRTPEDGDIVIREELRGGTLVYVLHTAPGADQYEFRSRDGGIAQAIALAKRQDVRAWLTDEGYDFVLLEDFRVVESVQTSEESLPTPVPTRTLTGSDGF